MIKKILIALLILLVIMGVLSLLASLKPGWIRTCNLGDFGISLKVPYAYANVSINREGNLLYLYNEENEIIISGIDVGKGFWKSDLPEERIDEYIKLFETINYDSEIKVKEKNVIDVSGKKVGKIKLEVNTYDEIREIHTYVTGIENGNVVLEIYGMKTSMNINKEALQEIMATLEIGENKHVYIDKPKKDTTSGDEVLSGDGISGDMALSGDKFISGEQKKDVIENNNSKKDNSVKV